MRSDYAVYPESPHDSVHRRLDPLLLSIRIAGTVLSAPRIPSRRGRGSGPGGDLWIFRGRFAPKSAPGQIRRAKSERPSVDPKLFGIYLRSEEHTSELQSHVNLV